MWVQEWARIWASSCGRKGTEERRNSGKSMDIEDTSFRKEATTSFQKRGWTEKLNPKILTSALFIFLITLISCIYRPQEFSSSNFPFLLEIIIIYWVHFQTFKYVRFPFSPKDIILETPTCNYIKVPALRLVFLYWFTICLL